MKSVNTKPIKKTNNTIAILYARAVLLRVTVHGIQDKYMVDQIEKLKKDKEIKAVVFRTIPAGVAPTPQNR